MAKQKVLIVDDAPVNIKMLREILRGDYDIYFATNGHEAMAIAEAKSPDIVLLDINMPDMDGYEVCRQLKADKHTQNIIVVFITAKDDEEDEARGLELGAIDYITKPFSAAIVTARIKNHLEVKRHSDMLEDLFLAQHQMAAELKIANQKLEEKQLILDGDAKTAKEVFNKINRFNDTEAEDINAFLIPLMTFSGDLFVVGGPGPDKRYLFLGDFTGHGLSAAIGAIPLTDVFYTMTGKGLPICDIVFEINKKLYNILPSGRFCCAILILWDRATHTLTYWNGGLPDAYLLDHDLRIKKTITSTQAPLGICEYSSEQPMCEEIRLEKGDNLVMYTDGLIEATGHDGAVFEEERLLQFFAGRDNKEELFVRICKEFNDFIDGISQHDDISLVSVDLYK